MHKDATRCKVGSKVWKIESQMRKWTNICKCVFAGDPLEMLCLPIESEYTQLDGGQPICLKDYEVIDWFSAKTHAYEIFADAEAEVLWMWETNCWRVHKKRQRPRCLYQLLWKSGELICLVVRGVCRPTPCHYYYRLLLIHILKVRTKTFT